MWFLEKPGCPASFVSFLLIQLTLCNISVAAGNNKNVALYYSVLGRLVVQFFTLTVHSYMNKTKWVGAFLFFTMFVSVVQDFRSWDGITANENLIQTSTYYCCVCIIIKIQRSSRFKWLQEFGDILVIERFFLLDKEERYTFLLT